MINACIDDSAVMEGKMSVQSRHETGTVKCCIENASVTTWLINCLQRGLSSIMEDQTFVRGTSSVQPGKVKYLYRTHIIRPGKVKCLYKVYLRPEKVKCLYRAHLS